MSWLLGRFRPPPQSVSITDAHAQVKFDSPAEMVDYLSAHPEVAENIHLWHWTLQEPQ
jgi:hypothetical protein